MCLPSVTVETLSARNREIKTVAQLPSVCTRSTTRSRCKLCRSHRPQNGNRNRIDHIIKGGDGWHSTHLPSCSTESRSYSATTDHQEEIAHLVGPSRRRQATLPEEIVQWTIHLVAANERYPHSTQQNCCFSCPTPAHQKDTRDVSTRVPALACTVFGCTKSEIEATRTRVEPPRTSQESSTTIPN